MANNFSLGITDKNHCSGRFYVLFERVPQVQFHNGVMGADFCLFTGHKQISSGLYCKKCQPEK